MMAPAAKEKSPSPIASGIVRACLSPAFVCPPEQVGQQLGWLEHLPFVFWLIETLRPRVVVELGTRVDCSYFALCQAVQALGLETRCYAVEIRNCEEHAGYYGEEVYQQVRTGHDRLYSAFSSLIRSSFDEALAHFSVGMIDLLHINDCHYYRDLKDDFDSWLPKLSNRSVVLLHKVNICERDVGVLAPWEKLRARHPSFEFVHGHGLGVLGIGSRLPGPIRELLAATAREEATTHIRNAYARLGSTVSVQFSTEQQGNERVQRAAKGSSARLSELERAIQAQLAEAARRHEELEPRSAAVARAVFARSRELRGVTSSLSWRFSGWVTGFLRKGARKFPWLARQTRRGIKLLWWPAERFRAWRRTPVRRRSLRRWTRPNAAEPGVNLIGPVEFISGLSTSVRGFMSCLAHAGIKLNVVPWRAGFERLRSVEISCHSTEWQPINLVHLNLDVLTNMGLLDRPPLVEIVSPERFNVAIVSWELASLLPEWANVIHRFDEIWCASSFMARSVAAVSARPVRVVRPAVEISSVAKKGRTAFGLPENRFIFFYTADAGSVLGRKNPKLLVDAYVEEFGPDDGAICLLKIHYSDPSSLEMQDLLSISARRPDVVVMDGLLEQKDMSNLYELIDCYVSPHRSEGLGLTILEAMNAKKPVIATQYGGVTDFVNGETAVPLEHRLTEIGEGHLPYPPYAIWADPIQSSLRSAMRRVFRDPDYARNIALGGRAHVQKMFSLDRTAGEIRAEIDRIWGRPQ
jgi:glycosyltransferase involved in cell wall biosynthesis